MDWLLKKIFNILGGNSDRKWLGLKWKKKIEFHFFQINLVGDIPLSLVPKRDDTAGWNWVEDTNKFWLFSDTKLNKFDKWNILLFTTLKYFSLFPSYFQYFKFVFNSIPTCCVWWSRRSWQELHQKLRLQNMLYS